MKQILFEEGFVDNTNGWYVGGQENGKCSLIDEGYLIEGPEGDLGFMTFREIPTIYSKAYMFEAGFVFRNGPSGGGFGLIWGLLPHNEKDKNANSGYNYFIIRPNGQFTIRSVYSKTNKLEILKDNNDSNQINIGEKSLNILKIEKFDDKIDNRLFFLINDQLVFVTSPPPFFGTRTGFIVFNDLKILVKYFNAYFFTE